MRLHSCPGQDPFRNEARPRRVVSGPSLLIGALLLWGSRGSGASRGGGKGGRPRLDPRRGVEARRHSGHGTFVCSLGTETPAGEPAFLEPLSAILSERMSEPDTHPDDTAAPTNADLLSTTDDELSLVGSQVGPYAVVRVLGRGGMGAVYLAEQHEPIRRSRGPQGGPVRPGDEAGPGAVRRGAPVARPHEPPGHRPGAATRA